MSPKSIPRSRAIPTVQKAPTGIRGLDEITGGGLPRNRPTLICGGPGCGKTILGMAFLANGALRYGEAGVFLSFEEPVEDLRLNFASLGLNLRSRTLRKRVVLDYARLDPNEIQETGAYNLDGLFLRLEHAIDSVGAKRVVLDTIEAIFSGLSDTRVVRAELRRLFEWLKNKKVTAIVTGERGTGTLTRYGLEEYITDCVIVLDHRVVEQNATRRLRVVKYRGSPHDADEAPFFIDATGVSVLPITSLGLQHPAIRGRVSSGVHDLDKMLGGKGYVRSSSILVSGGAGTGKTTVGAYLADAACRRGERALYFAFEESGEQIVHNVRSIGIELERWQKKGLLHIHAERATTNGLEGHLSVMNEMIEMKRPKVVIVDPISNLISVGTSTEVRAMLARLIDFLKVRGVTAMFTSLTIDEGHPEGSDIGISSFMDTWLLLRNLERNGERTRTLDVFKSRGVSHSNQVREFILTKQGLRILDVARNEGVVVTGSQRIAQAAMALREGATARKLVPR